MELLLIRHGQSTNNANQGDRSQHRPDPPLTDLGQQQAERAAAYLLEHEQPFDRLYTSPMLRCLQTTQPIARALGLKAHVWVDLHETGGIRSYQGDVMVNIQSMSRSEMADLFPDYLLPDEVTEQGWWHREAERLETMQATYERARGVAQEFTRIALRTPPDQPSQRLLVVSHGAFLDAFLRAMLFIPQHDDTWLMHHNTAMSQVRLHGEHYHRRALDFLNRHSHLPPQMLS